MSVPDPPLSLDDSCSVIHDKTLYSYSPQGFLSLRLEEGATWKKLAMGQKVVGATCVGTTPGDDSQAALFVVGGKADSTDYTGLQKFTYSTGNWTTVRPSDLVTQNRQWHSSTYIQADDVILVYAGSQDGTHGLSSQTFTIRASEPYDVRGYQSTAVPASSPIVMSWSFADAAMMSGDGASGNIYWFNPTAGWRDSGASLAQPVQKATGSMDAVLTTGSDGSKSIYTFDLSQSPNHVSRAVVQDASGKPVLNAAAIIAERDLTVENWPKYNATLAPTATRQNFAMAQGADGLVVFSSGNAKEPLALFDAEDNRWLNATEFFIGKKETMASLPTSTTAHSTPTASGTLSTTSEPSDLAVPPMQTSDSSASAMTTNTILGITLGTISCFLVLLGLIVFLLRLRRRRQLRGQARPVGGAGGPSAVEKELGLDAKILQSPSPNYQQRHQQNLSQDSVSSMAILMGRVGQQQQQQQKSAAKPPKSSLSQPGLQASSNNPLLQIEDDNGIVTTPTVPDSQASAGLGKSSNANRASRRSSGWNRYWSDGSALNILGLGASQRNTVASERSSRYSQAPTTLGEVARRSAAVPPLTLPGHPELSKVNSKSPVVSTPTDDVPWGEGLSGSIEGGGGRPFSGASSAYSSGIPESVHEPWDPTIPKKPWGTDRAPSGAYGSASPRVEDGPAPPALGVSKQPQLAMATISNDMSWLNLGDDGQR